MISEIARLLQAAGVRRGTRVGLHVERSPLMVAAMLGIQRAGGAYVPLDPALPPARSAHIVSDSGIRHLVHDGAPRLAALPQHAIDLSGLSIAADRGSARGALPAIEPAPGDLAYVMYTSGSTGRPKGVMIPHGALANFLAAMRVEPGLAARDVLLAVTTPAFDISALELFLPLLVGGRIVLASRSEVQDGAALARLIEAHGVTVMQATPATWRMLLLSGWTGAPRLKALCGGEALDPDLARRLAGATGDLWNMYGPTETTVWSTCGCITDPAAPIHVGRPIRDTTIRLIGANGEPARPGELGELYIGGAGLALGYTDEARTRERFVPDPLAPRTGARFYRTGDLARLLPDGTLEIAGRADDQVKVRGHRIELQDVQSAVAVLPGVGHAAVVCRRDGIGENELVAYVVPEDGAALDAAIIRKRLASALPAYMIPSVVTILRELPLTPNGKVDRAALSARDPRAGSPEPAARADRAPREVLLQLLREALGIPAIDGNANLFDLGLSSLQANHVVAAFAREVGVRASVAALFRHPTLDGFLARVRDGAPAAEETGEAQASRLRGRKPTGGAARGRGLWEDEAVAVIGMAARVPGAESLEGFWEIVASGADTVTRFDEADDDPVLEAETRQAPGYVRARGMIGDPALFDASLFGFSPHDAAVMDPQQRVFLEVAWEALEDAGYDPDRQDGCVGVYAGMGNNLYHHYHVATRPDLVRMVGEVQVEIGREKDHVATLVSHKLNLTGPSVSVHTACSTGLVAVDAACHSLLGHQCDMALAGAIELRTPQMSGQVHEPGGIFTADGRCRPFSADASGTMFSDGAGAVVLKRLSDALADGDDIRAVIRGSAVNHDGLHKKSYLAPSIPAQMNVIATAQARAGAAPGTISLMEAHGTATPVGDPIEFEALRGVFASSGDLRGTCALGSVKGNLGHPTTAAGIVGLIKASLCLRNRTIPPLANFTAINPGIDLETSPFYIPTEALAWPETAHPRRAGVSSFGFCGTNAHVVVEEAPPLAPRPEGSERSHEVLLLSAATETALDAMTGRLDARLRAADGPAATQAAYTLAVGRKRLRHRRFAVRETGSRDAALAVAPARKVAGAAPQLALIFPGQGSQYLGMGRGLYAAEPAFRAALDRCADILGPSLGEDIRTLMMDPGADAEEAAARTARLNDTRVTQPAVFCLSWALASLWTSWGARPVALVGHSIGEFVCAALAGVMSFEDALRLVAARGRLMGALPRGGMLSVRAAPETIADLIGPDLSIAAVNGPKLCVVAGPVEALDGTRARLEGEGIRSQRLHTSHAFHSRMMEPAVAPFRALVDEVALKAPAIEIVSTVTGRVLSAQEACDPAYWADHLVRTVRFADAVRTLWEREDLVALEAGPRGTMAGLASAAVSKPGRQAAIASLADTSEDETEARSLARAVGQLWCHGVELDWDAYFAGRPARRVRLPAYPFDRKRFWVEPGARPAADAAAPSPAAATVAVTATGAAEDRAPADALLDELRALLGSVSGEDMSAAAADATFFELGLDSLLLTPVTFLVKQRWGVPVTFRQLTGELSTLASLAAHLRTATGMTDTSMRETSDAGAASASGQERTPADGDPEPLADVPATILQRAVLHGIAADPATAAGFLESATIELSGRLAETAIQQAAAALVARHEALRARFSPDGTRMTIRPAGADEVALTIAALGAEPLSAVEDRELRRRPIDPVTGPPVRFTLVRLGMERHALIVTAHAAVCDGWSLDLMIEELGRLYGAALGRTSPLEPADSLLSHAAAEQAYLDGDEGRRAAAGRRRRLLEPAPPPPLALPGGHGALEDLSAAHEILRIDAALTAALRADATRRRCSLFTLLFTAYGAALARRTGQRDLILSVPSAGQAAANRRRLVGCCANPLPVRYTAPSDATSSEAVSRAQEALIEAQDAALVPFSLRPEGPPENPEARAVPRAALVHTKRLRPADLSFAGLEADYRLAHPRRQLLDLVVDVTEFEDRLLVTASYRPACTSQGFARQLLRGLRRELEQLAGPAMAASPRLAMADLA